MGASTDQIRKLKMKRIKQVSEVTARRCFPHIIDATRKEQLEAGLNRIGEIILFGNLA